MIHKLFFAVYPDPETAGRIAALVEGLRRRHGLVAPAFPPERYHVTLYGLGVYEAAPAAVLEGARAAAEAIAIPPFDVELSHVVSWGRGQGKRTLVLVGGEGVAGLEQVRAELEIEVPRLLPDLKPPPPFNPHMTVLYDPRVVAEEAIEPIRWRVDELVLVDSLHGRGRHLRLGGRRLG